MSSSSKPERKTQHLLRLLSAEELLQCLLYCAESSADCQQYLREWLRLRFPETAESHEEAREQVRKIFRGSNSKVRDDNPRRWNREWRTNWEQVLAELDIVLTSSEQQVCERNAEVALGVALQTFTELAETVDAEVLHGYVGGVYECAARAEELLKSAVRTRKLPVNFIQDMLEELRWLAVAPNLAGDGLELTPLFLWCCEHCLKPEGVLGMLDSLMEDPANAYDWQQLHLLESKMELLRKWGRESEIPPLIQQYLYIPELRRREVTRLMQNKQWKAALSLVEEGLRLAKKSHQWVDDEGWMDLKVKLLQKTGRSESALKLCRKRFIENGAQEADYRKLKSMVPPKDWKSYLRKAIAEIRNQESCNLLPIYAAENMHQELAAVLLSPWIDISTLVQYMKKLEVSYLPSLFRHLEQRVDESLRLAATREWYAQMAKLLHRVRTLPGGNALIDRMLEKYRTQYPRRPAMLEEFRKV